MADPAGWDVVVVGAGSVGTPAALSLAERGAKVLVLDALRGAGQGSNKAAIGGVRATHSEPAKILLGLRAVELFSTWKEARGDELEWVTGGYAFPAWREEEASTLKALVTKQRAHGLDISWLEPDALREVIPDLEPRGLRGGTWSPRDGHCSPLLALRAFHARAVQAGARFRFDEPVVSVETEGGRVKAVRTPKGRYATDALVVSAGAQAAAVGALFGQSVTVRPDAHEAGITEPVAPFLRPMVVDIRPRAGSSNCYFFQHRTGQVIFCMTPAPLAWGDDTRETSAFLPMVSRRLLEVMPRLSTLRVRRTWRGLYPMTPDGLPLVGWSREVGGCFLAAGLCGQGFMFGPSLGEVIARVVLGAPTDDDRVVLEALSPNRTFHAQEKLR